MDTLDASDRRRSLPSVSRLLEREDVQNALTQIPRAVLVQHLRRALDEARSASNGATADSIVAIALDTASSDTQPSLTRAINATGIVLHTGLGRALLSEAAQRAVADAIRGHSVLEVDSESGRRGSRQSHVRSLLCELTGAESALVLNNNAGAVFLAITALAAGREVIISRGELVEIGGSFRIPDIIRASGATLVEVGATNRTRLSDFQRAITERTALLLRCHPSNFRMVGFTEEAPAAELAALAHEHGISVMDDLGSGALVDTSRYASPTPTIQQSLEAGCNLVTASGDKLLGGPQSGIIVGKKDLVECIGSHPLARALRVDKMTLAALEATLRAYREPESVWREIPTLRYLSRTGDEIRAMAGRLAEVLRAACGDALTVCLVPESSQVGGGSLPGDNLPTTCVRLTAGVSQRSAESIASALRRAWPPVFARVKAGAVLLDPRTLEEDEFGDIAAAIRATVEE